MEQTTYTPEALAEARREEERRMVKDGQELWRLKKEESMRQKHREQSELRRMLANYWPWGRPGGGAPCASALRKRNVPLEPEQDVERLPQTWRTRSFIDRPRKSSYSCGYRDNYDNYDSYNISKFGSTRKIGTEDRGRNGIYRLDAAPPTASRQAPVDATQPGYRIDTWRASDVGSRDYINELAEQIRRKQEKALEDHHREQETSRRHFDTWRRLWGRPGHGAPIDQARRRNNLHDILYRNPVVANGTARRY